ncbi:hypothetical protein AL755_04265 [Arthrobacter sp. ERGS1:01]|uniref:hypothetical protein n=1 Tax=Arthrobacter sp. ERGS1:01 TaxID=1704044 RepID=UPI0006B46254|nr:hypothetical protein [Arthrobacter sp. ERGS1:01]ALE04896.1 hypothetical protein AL755_04265 [Arthrobacter sp. ERGS1:01]
MNRVPLPLAVQNTVDAINAADIDKFVGSFRSDGIIDDWGRVLRGRAGVRQWAETDAVGAGAIIDVFDADTVGVATKIRFHWNSGVFNGESSATVTVRDGLVASFQIPAISAT